MEPPMGDGRTHAFPTELTSFVGRKHDLEAISDLVHSHRLVSLVGPGGVGKTRLALESTASILESFPDGVWFIDLSSAEDKEVVPSLLASPFDVGNIGTHATGGMAEVLADYLATKSLLLLVDNCEHVRGEVDASVRVLLERCPNIKLLITSRVPIGLPGEIVYRVPPLPTPVGGRTDSEAVTLFLERLQLIDAAYEANEEDLEHIAEVVKRLDGLPLAIELAASRSKLFSPVQILERLSDKLDFLQVPDASTDRHETLLATIGWSYDLLSRTEQDALRRLSVFHSWTLEAARQFLGSATEQLLSGLIDNSLVEILSAPTGNRYRLLETVRQFGLTLLDESGASESTRAAHAAFFRDLAEESNRRLRTADQVEWVERMRPEHDNVRSALAWSIDKGEGVLALELTAAMGRFWFMQTHWEEALRWYRRVTEAFKADHPLPWARAFIETGSIELITRGIPERPDLVEEAYLIAREQGTARDQAMATYHLAELHPEDPKGLIDEAIGLFEDLGDQWGESLAKRWLGSKVELFGDPSDNIRYQREAVAGFTRLGDRWSAGWIAFDLGFSLLAVENYQEAWVAFEEALDLVSGQDGRLVEAHATRGLASAAAGLGDDELASDLFRKSVTMLERIGDKSCLAFTHMYLADIDSRNKRTSAPTLLAEAFKGFSEVNHSHGVAAVVRRLAREVMTEDPDLAARMLGAASTHGGMARDGLAAREASLLAVIADQTESTLGSDRFQQAMADGVRLGPETLVHQALAALIRETALHEQIQPAERSLRERVGRRLAAILMADIVGFSAQVAEDELGTHRRIQSLVEGHVDPLLAEWNGRLIKSLGDGFLCEFASAVDAVECARDWLGDIREGFEFRIGIALGDIIVNGEDVFGDGVNVAARLEGLAEPGSILISDEIQRQVRGRVDAVFEYLGPRQLKNIPERVGVYLVETERTGAGM